MVGTVLRPASKTAVRLPIRFRDYLTDYLAWFSGPPAVSRVAELTPPPGPLNPN
jgi:hypothetical protein